jgi:hypothetical protein
LEKRHFCGVNTSNRSFQQTVSHMLTMPNIRPHLIGI